MNIISLCDLHKTARKMNTWIGADILKKACSYAETSMGVSAFSAPHSVHDPS